MAEELLPNLNPATAAKYTETAARLKYSEGRAEARAKEAKEQTNSNYFYNRGAMLRAEPFKLRSSLNAANSQGLAESGTLARNQGQIQTDYAQKQGRLAEMRRNAVQKINVGLAENKVKFGEEGQANVAGANAEQNKWLIEHPPTPAATTPAPNANGWVQVPGGAYRNNGLVTPWTPTPAGAYRTSGAATPAPPTVVSSKPSRPRKVAAKKIVSGWGY